MVPTKLLFVPLPSTLQDLHRPSLINISYSQAAALAAEDSSSDAGDASDDSAAAERRHTKGKTAMDMDEDSEGTFIILSTCSKHIHSIALFSTVDEDFKAPDSGSDVAEEYDEVSLPASSEVYLSEGSSKELLLLRRLFG